MLPSNRNVIDALHVRTTQRMNWVKKEKSVCITIVDVVVVVVVRQDEWHVQIDDVFCLTTTRNLIYKYDKERTQREKNNGNDTRKNRNEKKICERIVVKNWWIILIVKLLTK